MTKWTPTEDATLTACAAANLPLSAAASTLSRTRSACAGRARRLGLIFNSTPHIPKPRGGGRSWSTALFEPYANRKARHLAERAP